MKVIEGHRVGTIKIFEVFALFFSIGKNPIDRGAHLHLDRACLSKIMPKRPLGNARPHRDGHLMAGAESQNIPGEAQCSREGHWPAIKMPAPGLQRSFG